VQVDLISPASDLPAIVSSPTLAVVPKGIDAKPSMMRAGSFVGSGGYVLSDATETELTLTANSHYWAGRPAIRTVNLILDTGGQSPVDMFEAGDLDYTPISAGDATWIAYDKRLGPSLRLEPSPSVLYYGFDTTRAPFNDVHVRRAFALGIDWKRLVEALDDPVTVAATGMVPVGVPGHSSTDYGPRFDLAAARQELSAAGYSGGSGFPEVTLITTGTAFDGAIVRQLRDNLGIEIGFELMGWSAYNEKLSSDSPPAFWFMDWVADYPGAYDFLGILLGSHQPNNFAGWTDQSFEQALATAEAATDQTAMQAGFDQAQSIVQDQAPVIPVAYGAGYALAAKGLLGALPNSEGIVRYAGLAWGS
jgi:oligopeptide transport system substrate-binding protein